MGKLKVLMIGPGEPNSQNSGLGVASHHIANQLAQKTKLTLIQPNDSGKFSELSLTSDLTKINVRAKLNPYFYASSEILLEEEEDNDEYEDSIIRNELNAFTNSALSKSRKVDFDIIYAHDWTAMPAAVKIQEETKKPLVVHVHSLDYDRGSKLDNSWVYELEKQSLEKSDAIISVSDYSADVISNEYGTADNAKIHTVYNGNEPLVYNRRQNPFKEKIVLFVGRLTGQKGPSIFLEIAEAVLRKNENVRFVLAGEGHMMMDLIATAAAKGIGGKFHFTGHVDKEKLQELYSIADVYCMPSVSEPFGLTAIEAANAGIPIVLSKQSGAAEVLSGSLTADHWDASAFAKNILRILKDDKKSEKMVAANKADIKSLTWQNTVDKVLEVFNSIS